MGTVVLIFAGVVTVYPFMGGKVWCRYGCPLAKLMQMQSKLFARLGWSRFHIEATRG